MKLEELLPQLHDKITYFICLNRGISIPILCITKTTDIKITKLPLLEEVCYMLSLVGQNKIILGTRIRNVAIDQKEIVENKHDYIKFNKHRKFED